MSLRLLQTIKDVHDNVLQADAPLADVPEGILKVQLRPHQLAVLHAMQTLETAATSGLDCSGEKVFSSYGVLGDSVGVGKSLMVLGHIARLKTLPDIEHQLSMDASSSKTMFSIKQKKYAAQNESGSLIIVPHTLFRQWADYIKKQTNLKCMLLDRKKVLENETFIQDILNADVVLISNTLYKWLSVILQENNVRWKRVFIDEADTIHLVGGYPKPEARFTWYITASWINMIFPHAMGRHITTNLLQQYIFREGAPYAVLKSHFQDVYSPTRPYTYVYFSITSQSFFREAINSQHHYRGRFIIKCSDEFINQSISLPNLTRRNILCKAPLNHQIVSGVISEDVKQLLHAGDIDGAIAALGVKSEDTKSLIDAVTRNLQKELERLRALHTFKSGLEYSSQHAKEAAMKSLEDKIKQKEEAIQCIHARIEGFKNEMCPICYDEPNEPLLTPCCSRIFCAQCILMCLSRGVSNCPLCREKIATGKLTKVVTQQEMNMIVNTQEEVSSIVETQPLPPLEKKMDALLRIFTENPNGKFLVFSKYDNPFVLMETLIQSLGIRVNQLKGNKDAINSTLHRFENGELKCLLLNSHYAGAGLNITAATHVILLHAMTHEEEKQIIGRAYRMGRKEPLTFIRLLHSDEMPTQN